MKITFLGTGTSHGVPVIGCDCDVCTSVNPKNRRFRTSALLENPDGPNLLIDASVDFRQQALRAKICTLTDILITHEHADHIFGLDDTRIFTHHNEGVNVYLDARCDKRLRQVYDYVYGAAIQEGGGLPKFNNILIEAGNTFQAKTFTITSFTITPIPIFHGKLPILGFRVNNLAYLTDCSHIPETSFAYLNDLDLLVLGALRPKPHPTHFSLSQAVEAAHRIGARQTYFTHITHRLEHDATNAALPPGMQLAHDGLVVEV